MAPLRHALSRMMRSLVMKFTVLCAIVLVAATLVMTGIGYVSKSRDNRDTALAHAGLMSQLLAVNIAEQTSLRDARRLTVSLSAFSERDDVSGTYVADVTRNVLVATDGAQFAPGERTTDALVHGALGSVDMRVETVWRDYPGGAPGHASGASGRRGCCRRADCRRVPPGVGNFPAPDFCRPDRPRDFPAAGRFRGACRTRPDSQADRGRPALPRRASWTCASMCVPATSLRCWPTPSNRMFARLDASMKRIHRLAYVDMVTELPQPRALPQGSRTGYAPC